MENLFEGDLVEGLSPSLGTLWRHLLARGGLALSSGPRQFPQAAVCGPRSMSTSETEEVSPIT